MKRIPEPELMLDEKQVDAYSQADFSTPHNHFVTLFDEKFTNWDKKGRVLDLGCGTCDVVVRFATRYFGCTIDALDGSEIMLLSGEGYIRKNNLEERVKCICDMLPCSKLRGMYDATISNSLLHHMSEPMALWETIEKFTNPSAPVFVMDLMRPDSPETARKLVEQYASDEAEILKHDFYHSLLAAYSIEEVQQQLKTLNLSKLSVEAVSDRHFIVYGRM